MNRMRRDEQVGFTRGGGRIADNLFIVQECVQEVFKRREEMVMVTINFKKAYDSIKREKIIEVLQEYRIEGRLVELFKRVYTEDGTRLVIREQSDVKVDIESEIWQGCTASTVLFKMVTYNGTRLLRH